METTPNASLALKLVKIMETVGRVPKNGRNKFHGYDYATEGDVAEAVRKALIAERVVFLPSVTNVDAREITTSKGNTERVTTVTLDCSFIDAESGAVLRFNMAGSGQDAGDKGTMKAVTAGVKYALMKSLCIPTGDDPEADTKTDESHAKPETTASRPKPTPVVQMPESPEGRGYLLEIEGASTKHALEAIARNIRDGSLGATDKLILSGAYKRRLAEVA